MNYLICFRLHSTHGYLPKIVSSESEVEWMRKWFKKNNVDGDFSVELYEGPILICQGDGE